MVKVNYLSKVLFITIPIALIVIYKIYGSQPNIGEPNNYKEISGVDLHGERIRIEVSELNSLLSGMKASLNSLNKQLNENKQASEKRMIKIELSIREMAAAGEISPDESVEELLLSPLEESQYRQELVVEQMRTFNEALAEEERDEGWATEMEDTIWAASQNEMFSGSTFNSPTCKSTFCQFEAYHEDSESRDNFENIRRTIPNSFHIQHYEEGGELRSVVYFIKRDEEPNNIIFETLNGPEST